jgi:hypothetical protein
MPPSGNALNKPIRKKKIMNKTTALIVGSCSAIVAGIIVVLISFSSSSPSSPPSVETQTGSVTTSDATTTTTAASSSIYTPLQDLTGTWSADSGSGGVLTATVKDGVITITMNNEGAKMLYWVGTFQSTADPGNTVNSTKVEVRKAVLSRATSKEFTVGDNAIFFEFSAMGKTTKMELRRA